MSFLQDSKQGARGLFLNPPRQAYSFPILKPTEIILCLNELGISVMEDEIINPDKNKDQIRRIYEYMTELCTGITRDEMSQPAFSGLKQLTYPELHEESIPQINFLRACQKMMEVCGIYDFTMKDLMTPTAKRLRRHLSGILNFAKFREERFALLADLNAHRESVLSAYNNSKTTKDELTRKLAQLQEQTRDEAAIISAIEVNCRNIEHVISELNHKQAEMREEIADLKLDNGKLKDTLSARNVYLDELVDNKKKLQSQIVQSPDKFRRQISDVASTLQVEQQNIRNSERTHREIMAWAMHVDDCIANVGSAQDSLNELHVEANKHSDTACSLSDCQQQVASKRDSLKALELTVHQLQRQCSRAEEKLSHIRQQGGDRTQESRLAIDQLHAEIIKAEKNQKDAADRACKYEAEVKQLQKQYTVERQLQDQACCSLLNESRFNFGRRKWLI